MKEELVLSIWFIVDIATEESTDCIIKSYNLNGTDEEKVRLLKILAETDFKTGERITYVSNPALPKSLISYIIESDSETFIHMAEIRLPKQYSFIKGYSKKKTLVEQHFSNAPLYLWTVLGENEYGEIRPLTTSENKQWYENEKMRILLNKVFI